MPVSSLLRARTLLALLALARSPTAGAAPAPSLVGTQWISEGPVARAPRPLLVVEVWATWCGPCHATFPLLTRLQRDHGDRVRVVALSDDAPEAVRRTFHANPGAMRFAIGVVDALTVRAFLFGGFGGRGIPSTFLIEEGEVVWGGPPEELEEALLARLRRPPAPPPADTPPPD